MGEDKTSSSVPPLSSLTCFLLWSHLLVSLFSQRSRGLCACQQYVWTKQNAFVSTMNAILLLHWSTDFFFLRAVHSVLWISKGEYYRSTCSKFSPLKICPSHQTSASRPDVELHRHQLLHLNTFCRSKRRQELYGHTMAALVSWSVLKAEAPCRH